MANIYKCKTCKKTEDPTYISESKDRKFFTSNKSRCKKCISCKNKIDRLTVKRDDSDVRHYCMSVGIDFNQICLDSEANMSPKENSKKRKEKVEKSSEKDEKYKNHILMLIDKVDNLEMKVVAQNEYISYVETNIHAKTEEIRADIVRLENKSNKDDTKIIELESEIKALREMMGILKGKMFVK